MKNPENPSNVWFPVGKTSPDALRTTREIIHQAIQLPALAARGILPPDPTETVASLFWSPEKRTLFSQDLSSSNPHKVGLRFKDLGLLIENEAGQIINETSLVGLTYAQGFSWLKSQLEKLEYATDRLSTDLPYAIPAYPQASGTPFSAPEASATDEFSAYFDNATLALEPFRTDGLGDHTTRTWPHHFDIATLISVELDLETQKNKKTVGVGLSPGDGGIAEPYFYVNFWPRPDMSTITLPELAGHGQWNTEGWIGAVLTRSDLIAHSSEKTTQSAQTAAFLKSAVTHLKGFLDLV